MKLNVASITFITAALFSLSACKDETKSETCYKSHPDETYKVYKNCLDSGEASDNCEFARRAAISFAQLGDEQTKAKFLPLMKR